MRIGERALLAGVIALFSVADAAADAIVRTQAMSASTIAEIFIEDDRIRVELEIGLADLQAFPSLLPDEIYERFGNEPKPLAERVSQFFDEDFVIIAGDGPPIPGRILEMGPRERVRRDEITGEPLPATDEEPETVIFGKVEYPLSGRPETVTVGGLAATKSSIGFVLYHDAIPVNDFRYLSQEQTVELDWDDPWYSQFPSRALRRSYYAPMNGFIYVEPYEVRKEIIVRPKDLQSWIDLGLEGRETIPVEMQDELKRTVAEFLRQRQVVVIDDKLLEPELAQINFLERTLRTSRVIDPPVELDVDSAILGAIFVYPTDGLPERVTMDWDLFNERIQRIPVAAVDQAGPLPSYLEPDYNVLEWQNFLKNPQIPTLIAVSTPPGAIARLAMMARWPLALLSVGLLAWLLLGLRRAPDGWAARAAVVAVATALTAGCFWAGRGATLSEERTGDVVAGLLHNIYRAFDYRKEGDIYDVLDKSVSGDLLTDIYLETRRGLELANQGGARAKVKEIELVEIDAEAGDDGGFVATATWVVGGSVGHWGHVHQRKNQYRAELDIRPVDGAWKLSGIEVLQEERL